jgi:predicted nucleotidyltransferase
MVCRLIERRFGISNTQLGAMWQWAERNPYVGEVRVFGSRPKWHARIDSDLDIAITATEANYWTLANQWETELSEATGLRAKLKHYNHPASENVRRYCDDFSVLLFQRASRAR